MIYSTRSWKEDARILETGFIKAAAIKCGYYIVTYEDIYNVTPVSYTHLDVYKRQLQEGPQCFA